MNYERAKGWGGRRGGGPQKGRGKEVLVFVNLSSMFLVDSICVHMVVYFVGQVGRGCADEMIDRLREGGRSRLLGVKRK